MQYLRLAYPAAEALPARLLYLLVAALLAFAVSCASLRKHGTVGGAAAAGGAAGSLLGPGGAAVGAGAGAIIAGSMTSEEEFRSGDVVGEEALRREMDRWRATALSERARAQETSKWLWMALLVGTLYFGWRNREYLMRFGPGWFAGLKHAILGGAKTRPIRVPPHEMDGAQEVA